MASLSDEISSVGDVSFLITRLKLAKTMNETYMIKAIVSRLREIGVLREEDAAEHASFKNLRAEVTKILETPES